MCPVRCLLLDGRVPPTVEVEDVVRRRQVQAPAPRSGRDYEDSGAAGFLAREGGQQVVALARIELAVEEAHLAAGAFLEMADQAIEARVLREDERLVLRRHVLQQLDQA